MNLIINDITIEYSSTISTIKDAMVDKPHLKILDDKFSIDVYTIGEFYAEKGSRITVKPHEGTDQKSIDLILNGSIFGAILHQKKILPLHGSSFSFKGKGITICGRSGVGKSSVTTAFCQNGGQFITDDITPIKIDNNIATIVSTNNHIKLWDDTLQTLSIESNDLEKIRPTINKFYFLPQGCTPSEQRLDMLFILSTHHKDSFSIQELNGIEKYNALRDQIYRKNFLKGMPETQRKYFQDLVILTNQVKVISITRPRICNIYSTMRFIENEITK